MTPSRHETDPKGGVVTLQVRGWVVSVILCLVAGLGFAFEWRPVAPESTARLEAKINPNTAPVASLTRLPRIGPTRAQAIVAHRQGGRDPVFQEPSDLGQVSGIGPRTVEDIAPWLDFDSSQPTPPVPR